MKRTALTILLAGLAGSAAAAGTCEDLAAEIADKLRANGVTGFEVEIVPTELAGGDKVVGSCDRGRKKITYTRVAAARPAAAPASRPR